MKVAYSARSHKGKVRENNEDNLYVDGVVLTSSIREFPFAIDGSINSPAIFAVCDGMGGEDNGEVASQIAVHTLLNISDLIKSAKSDQLKEMVQLYVNRVNETIHCETNALGKRTGTTLALVVSAVDGVYCFNIGDSRIYCLQKSAFGQVTNDHTLFAEQQRNSALTRNQAANEKTKHKLTRCIGIGNAFTVESYPPIFRDCRMLICSDGLTDMVRITEIERVLHSCERSSDAADMLLGLALKNGGGDNVTIIVADIKKTKKHFFVGW